MAQQVAPQQAFGVVKSVLSGDCIIVIGGNQMEKTLVLSGLIAPKPCRNPKNPPDEPYAYEAREFLRKKMIGKQVCFTTVAQSGAGGREYANVSLDGENITHSLLKAGLASVKPPQPGQRVGAEKQILVDLEQQAKDNGLGQHSKDSLEDHIRQIDWAPNAMDLYNKFKGQEIPAVVNQFREGTNVRLEVMGSVAGGLKSGKQMMMVTLNLAGASSPRLGLSLETRVAQHEKKSRDNPEYNEDIPTESEAPAPFAVEAQQFAESRLLHRDVHLVILGVDVTNNLYGVLKYTKGNITMKLLENGLASYMAWSALLTGEQDALQVAVQAAKAKRVGLWGSDNPPNEEKRPHFQGRIVQIASGDTLVVEKEEGESKTELRVILSSIRAPKFGRPSRGGDKEKKSDAFAMDAREFLRKRLIGKKVNVSVDYTRQSSNRLGDTSTYVTVMDKSENVAVALVAAGLAEVVPHQRDEERSIFYCKIFEAQMEAMKRRLGKWLVPAPIQTHINDITDKSAESKSGGGKAKEFLKFLQHDRPNTVGVVEFCFGPTKFKIYCPKDNCMIALALVGVKVPRDSPLEAEASDFVKSRIFQHNVRLDIETTDAGNNFIGSLYLGNLNIGAALLREGYASIFPFSASRSPSLKDLEAAEDEARKARRGLWKDFVEDANPVTMHTGDDSADTTAVSSTGSKGTGKMDIKVTEVTDAVNFYYRDASHPDGALVDAKMAEFPQDLPAAFSSTPPLGTLVAGLYNDGNWYRARVEGRSGSADVKLCFVDFGNHEILPLANLRPLFDDLQRVPPQAKPAILAGLKPPASNSDHFEGAAICFNECALERVLTAQVEFTSSSGKVHVTLTDPEHPDITLNMMMARDGWCRVLEKPESWKLNDYCKSLKKDEDIAKQAKLNIWEYGNVSDDEEETTVGKGRQGPGKPAPAKGGGGAPAKAGAAPAKNSNLTKFDGRPPKRVV